MSCKIATRIIGEYGFEQALFGLGLSYGITSGMSYSDFIKNDNLVNKMSSVAEKLCSNDGGHNKFLESIKIWLDVDAPRFWWSEADTYRLSSKNSESTMHTLVNEAGKYSAMIRDFFNGKDLNGMSPLFLARNMGFFWTPIKEFVDKNFDIYSEDDRVSCEDAVFRMAYHIAYSDDVSSNILFCKRILPESFMQRREWCIDYKCFRNIMMQRYNHKLPHWKSFIDCVHENIEHPELVTMKMKMYGSVKVNG